METLILVTLGLFPILLVLLAVVYNKFQHERKENTNLRIRVNKLIEENGEAKKCIGKITKTFTDTPSSDTKLIQGVGTALREYISNNLESSYWRDAGSTQVDSKRPG